MSEEHELVMNQVKEFAQECLDRAGLNLKCEAVLNENRVTIMLDGEDNSLALREHAQLLYSLNHLINQVFFRKYQRKYDFVVDCEKYRLTREMELQLLASKAAERVAATGQPFRLQPMPSSERRVIHLTLAETEGVRTVSEGTGRYRRVIIQPSS